MVIILDHFHIMDILNIKNKNKHILSVFLSTVHNADLQFSAFLVALQVPIKGTFSLQGSHIDHKCQSTFIVSHSWLLTLATVSWSVNDRYCKHMQSSQFRAD